MRREKVEITKGTSYFELMGQAENILYVNKKPFAYEWCDNKGSIAKYLSRGNSKIELSSLLESMRYYAEKGIPGYVKLQDAISPLLTLLSNGQFELIYPFISTGHGLDLVEYKKNEVVNFYPTDLSVICLQAPESLDSNRVSYYKEKISSGLRPVIFVLGCYEGGDKYILDGHHKAQAYFSLKVEPSILFIKKIEPLEFLTEDQQLKAINQLQHDNSFRYKHPLADHKKT